ncbi:MAG TPA: MOSC domain-containing protein, partial [Cupriavidus sp.]|nr:MOSC domain-containing protein [Cupriavidus sp.]
GVYLGVVQPGVLRAGDAVILVPGPRDVPLNTLLHRNGRQISR